MASVLQARKMWRGARRSSAEERVAGRAHPLSFAPGVGDGVLMDALHRLLPVFSSTALMLVGIGLVGSLVPLAVAERGGSESAIGLLGSAYFLGLAVGTFRVGPHLARVGHVRAFSALTSVATATVLLLMVFDALVGWLLARFVFGVAIGGMYVVIESWLSDGSEPRERGQVLSAYLFTVYGSTGVGQWLIAVPDETGTTRMVLAASLMALASVPLVDTDRIPPAVLSQFRIEPRAILRRASGGVLGAVVAGVLSGAVFGVAPAYASRQGLSPLEISAFMTAFVVGGMLLQLPMGRASDTLDRRLVLAGAAGLAALGSALAIGLGDVPTALGLAALVIGGGAFSIYAIAVAYTLDRVDAESSLSANATLLLLYCLGSVAGSSAAAGAMQLMGAPGFFVALLAPSLALAGYATWLASVNEARDDKHDALYAPQTTPRAIELHPDFPSHDGEVDPVVDDVAAEPVPERVS